MTRILIIIFTLLSLISCDGSLKNSEAKKLILEVYSSPIENFEGFFLCYNQKFDTVNDYHYQHHRKLFALNLLKLTNRKCKNDENYSEVILTDYGKKFLSKKYPYNSDSSGVFFVTSLSSFNKIDSIVTTDESNATAYVEVRLSGITPIGKYVYSYYENVLKKTRVDFVKRHGKWELWF